MTSTLAARDAITVRREIVRSGSSCLTPSRVVFICLRESLVQILTLATSADSADRRVVWYDEPAGYA